MLLECCWTSYSIIIIIIIIITYCRELRVKRRISRGRSLGLLDARRAWKPFCTTVGHTLRSMQGDTLSHLNNDAAPATF